MVGFGVFRVVAGGAPRGLARGLETELHGDGAGDLVLNGLNLGNAARELLAPELGVLGDIDQFHLDVEIFAAQRDTTGEDGVDAELASGLHGVNLRVFVAEGSGSRHDTKLRLLRKRIGERLGDSVAEVVEIRVASHVEERKNGERFNGAGNAATRATAPGCSGRKRPQHEEQIADGLEARGRLLLEAVSDDTLDVRIRKRRGILPQSGGQGVAGGMASEGAPAAEQLIEHAAEREDVAAGVHGLAANLFG